MLQLHDRCRSSACLPIDRLDHLPLVTHDQFARSSQRRLAKAAPQRCLRRTRLVRSRAPWISRWSFSQALRNSTKWPASRRLKMNGSSSLSKMATRPPVAAAACCGATIDCSLRVTRSGVEEGEAIMRARISPCFALRNASLLQIRDLAERACTCSGGFTVRFAGTATRRSKTPWLALLASHVFRRHIAFDLCPCRCRRRTLSAATSNVCTCARLVGAAESRDKP